MSWQPGQKRMQYQGLVSQIQSGAAGDQPSDISILPGFKDSSFQNRNNGGIQSNVLPIHDGGGDAPRHSSESFSGRALKARKSAQMEYREQLDLQIAQQKQLREMERQREAQNSVRNSPMRGPIVAQVQSTRSSPMNIVHEKPNIPAVQCWLIPQSPSPVVIGEKCAGFSVTGTCSPIVGSPTKNVQMSPPPAVVESKSDPICHRRPLRTSLYQDVVFGHLKNHGYVNSNGEFEASTPIAGTHPDPQLPTAMRQPLLVFEDPEYPESNTEDYPAQGPRTGVQGSNQNVGPEIEQAGQPQQCVYSGGTIYTVSPDSSGVFPRCSAMPVILNPSDGSGAPVFSPSPQQGTSPCGSVFGDGNCMGSPPAHNGSGNESVAESPSFKQHISQTADQRPVTSVRNSAYKSALQMQIEERKIEEQKRRELERLADQVLQEKIKRDQERMQKEYEEEKLRIRQKEEEKRQREEETLRRQKELIKEAEEARKKAMQERRERLSGANNSTEQIPEQITTPVKEEQKDDRPGSPPIPAHASKAFETPPPPIAESHKTQGPSSGRLKETNASETIPKSVTPPRAPAPQRQLPTPKVKARSRPIAKPKNAIPPNENNDTGTPPTTTNHREGNSYCPNSGIAETLKFLEKVREALRQEMEASQICFEQQLEELGED